MEVKTSKTNFLQEKIQSNMWKSRQHLMLQQKPQSDRALDKTRKKRIFSLILQDRIRNLHTNIHSINYA